MEKIIEVINAGFAYGSHMVWENINFSVSKGELLCFLGANGCGKTTLLNCLHKNQRLSHGKIQIDDTLIEEMDTIEISKKIGVVFQEHTTVFPYSVLDVVLMGRGPHLNLFETPKKKDIRIAEEVIEQMGITNLIYKKYTELSGGEKQLVLIARTLAQKPEVILLDEPTSSLDFKNQVLVLDIIRELTRKGLTVIMTSHFPDHAFACADRVALLSNGSLVGVGETHEVMTESNLRKTYDIPVKIISVDDRDTGRVQFCMPYGKTENSLKER